MSLRFYFLWLLLLVAFCRPGAAQQATWHKVALDSVATLAFPDSVSQRREGAFQLYTCTAESTVYLAMSKPAGSVVGLLSNSPRFYDGMVQQWLKEVNGKLVSRHPVAAGAFKGVEIEFTTPKNPELPATKFTRMLVVNNTLYILNCWTNAEADLALPERTRFFNSFQVKAQPALQNKAYQIGHLVGRLAAYAALLLVAIGAASGGILLFRRWGKHRN